MVPQGVRARGRVAATFREANGRTGPDRVHQAGGLRLLFPRSTGGCEGVLVNTGGGIAGGDRWDLAFVAGQGARVTLTSQSAERVYRAQCDPAAVAARIVLERAAAFEWLPQETILFDGAHLDRSIEIEMAPDASLTLVESVVFGRASMGEQVVAGALRDRWRVRRGGTLVFADELRLEGNPARVLDRPACGGGARAIATILIVAPDAEERLEGVRLALASTNRDGPPVENGASAWAGKLVVRLASISAASLRGTVAKLLTVMRRCPLPRVWQ